MAIHQLVECKRQINGKMAKEGTAQNGIERDRKEQREYRVEQAGRRAQTTMAWPANNCHRKLRTRVLLESGREDKAQIEAVGRAGHGL